MRQYKPPRFKRYAIIAGKVVEGLANPLHLDVLRMDVPSDTGEPNDKRVRYAMPRCFQFRTREQAEKALECKRRVGMIE